MGAVRNYCLSKNTCLKEKDDHQIRLKRRSYKAYTPIKSKRRAFILVFDCTNKFPLLTASLSGISSDEIFTRDFLFGCYGAPKNRPQEQ